MGQKDTRHISIYLIYILRRSMGKGMGYGIRDTTIMTITPMMIFGMDINSVGFANPEAGSESGLVYGEGKGMDG